MKEEERNEPRFTLLPLCSFLLLHSFLTTPLCSFIRLVCNGLKRWRKHETSRIKETKNVVFSFGCGEWCFIGWLKQKNTKDKESSFILGLCSCCHFFARWTLRDSSSFHQNNTTTEQSRPVNEERKRALHFFFSSFPSSFVLFHHSSFLSFIRFYFNGM